MKQRLIMAIMLMTFIFSCNSFASQNITLKINNKSMKVTSPSETIDKNTYLPANIVLEKLGFKVELAKLQKKSKHLIAKKNNFVIDSTFGDLNVMVNNSKLTTTSPSKIINNKAYITPQFIIDVLKLEVEINAKEGKFTIDKNKKHKLTINEIKKKTNQVVYIASQQDNGIYSGMGTGFIISSDGKIVTNYHVIERTRRIEITFMDGKKYTDEVRILDYDKNIDLAVLKIKAEGLPFCALGDSEKVEEDDTVVAIGSPEGARNTVTSGKVIGFYNKNIYSDVKTNHGSSGGPLFNLYGDVIGVTTWKAEDEKQNVSISVPTSKLNKLKLDKNFTLSEFFDYEYYSGKTKISYSEYQNWLKTSRKNLCISDSEKNYNQVISFSGVRLLENEENFELLYFIDKNAYDKLKQIRADGYENLILFHFRNIALDLKDYYGDHGVVAYIIYKDNIISSEIINEYKTDKIKDFLSITYNDTTGKWDITYPIIRLTTTLKEKFSFNYMWSK